MSRHAASTTPPRPSRARSSTLRRLLRAVHRRRVRRPADGGTSRRSTRPPRRSLAEVARGRAGGRRPRGARPPGRPTSGPGRRCRARSAPSTCSGSPGIIQERARELAVLETLDNGKPIKESRDVDIPLAAAHFFYYAGWADKLEYAGLGPDAAAARRGRAGHPVELPAADAGLEDRAGAGRRQHRRAQAGRDHAADRAAVRRDLPAGRPAARAWSTSSPAPAPPARRWSPTPASTRWRSPARPRSARRSPRPCAGTGKKLTLELGGKAANIVFDDAPIDQAVEGIVNGIFFNQGHVCCAGLPAAGAGVDRRGAARRAAAADGDAAPRRPAGQEHRHRRDQLRAPSWTRSASWPTSGEAEGAERWSPPCELPERGFWFPPTLFTGVVAGAPDRPGGDLRPGAVGADLPHPGRGGREGQQHALRAVRRRVDREGLADPLDGGTAAGRRRLGQHLQQVRPGLAVRRLQGVGLRPRGRPPRPGRLPRRMAERVPESEAGAHRAARRPQDLQALHRRRVPALGVRAVLRGRRTRRRRVPGQRRAGLAQGRAGRGRRGPQGASPAGRAPPRTTAARSSTGWPRCWRAAARSSPPRSLAAEGAVARRRRRRSTRRSTAGSGTRLDRQVAQVAGRGQPGRRAVLQLLHPRADRRRRRSWRRRARRCSGWSACSPR